MKKRVLSLILAFCLLPCLPVRAYQSGSLSGLAVAEDGSLLVCDTWNKVIWRVSEDGAEIFAGVIPAADLSGEPQGIYHDDAADSAYFMEPWDIAPFLDGWAVSDAGANVIRYIEDGAVYTLAGSGNAADNDGNDRTASFHRPTGLAAGDDGALYVADTGNGAIRRVAVNGAVTTWAEGLAAPMGLFWHDGALYVAETGRSQILKLTDGETEIVAGVSDAAEDEGEYYGGYADGPAGTARFDHPEGVAVGDDGTIYVADTLNRVVREIRDGRVYTVARSADGISAPVAPSGIAVAGETVFVSDAFTGGILAIAPREPDLVFEDVGDEDWFVEEVVEGARRGLVSGTADGAFSPRQPLSRAMFVTMLSRLHRSADGSAVINGSKTFDDIEDSAYYAAPARWAIDYGVVLGMDGGFAPDFIINREQIATMLYRYAGLGGYDVSGAEDADTAAFADAGEISVWAEASMRWAVATGIMQGDDEGRLRPGDPTTRAEAVTLLIRFMDVYSL